MHEEPIVCSPSDALRAFVEGGLDYLAMGNYLLKQPEVAAHPSPAGRDLRLRNVLAAG
jgi:hypothetical protein